MQVNLGSFSITSRAYKASEGLLLLWSGSEYPEVLLSLVRVVLTLNDISGMFGSSLPCYFFIGFQRTPSPRLLSVNLIKCQTELHLEHKGNRNNSYWPGSFTVLLSWVKQLKSPLNPHRLISSSIHVLLCLHLCCCRDCPICLFSIWMIRHFVAHEVYHQMLP